MRYHIIAFLLGFILDLIFGDPYWLPHPIRWIGNLIGALDRKFLGNKDNPRDLSGKQKRRRGRLTVLIVCGSTVVSAAVILIGGYLIYPLLGCLLETIMTYQLLATKCLRVESMKVYDRLENGSLEEARYAVSMIVGRDTAELSATQVAKAAVETVAENASDGVIAPMICTAIGGPILGFLYKSINTMDSMIGYKNDRFMDFGRFAAKLDDLVNFVPSRISAWLMIFSCGFLGREFSGKNAVRIFKRDRFNHASPNSAQTEAACAGALGVQLAGNASYFGKIVEKPTIGDDDRPVENRDIIRANRLMYATAGWCEFICLIIMVGAYLITL